eukprot:1155727-Pelagomonas_calceolata.AAC.3
MRKSSGKTAIALRYDWTARQDHSLMKLHAIACYVSSIAFHWVPADCLMLCWAVGCCEWGVSASCQERVLWGGSLPCMHKIALCLMPYDALNGCK